MSQKGRKRVVVVGGGFTGTTLVQELDAKNKFDITLIDERSELFYNIGGLRAAVDPNTVADLTIPRKKVKNSTFIQGKVTEITPEQVLVEGRDPITFDILVIATGISYAIPAKPEAGATSKEAIAQSFQELHAALETAKRVLVVGGGAVGVELVGELATEFPKKEITLAHSKKRLLYPMLHDKTLARVDKFMADHGVNVVRGERVAVPDEYLERGFNAGTLTLSTDKGTEIESDVQFFMAGPKVNSEAYAEAFADNLDEHNRLKVDGLLRVEGHDNVYALGDCNNTAGPKLGYVGMEHAKTLAKILLALEAGQTPKAKLMQPMGMVVTLGRNGGATQFGGMRLGNFMTKQMKAKDVMAGRFWKEFAGEKAPSTQKN